MKVPLRGVFSRRAYVPSSAQKPPTMDVKAIAATATTRLRKRLAKRPYNDTTAGCESCATNGLDPGIDIKFSYLISISIIHEKHFCITFEIDVLQARFGFLVLLAVSYSVKINYTQL
jgi:hypothetical protein